MSIQKSTLEPYSQAQLVNGLQVVIENDVDDLSFNCRQYVARLPNIGQLFSSPPSGKIVSALVVICFYFSYNWSYETLKVYVKIISKIFVTTILLEIYTCPFPNKFNLYNIMHLHQFPSLYIVKLL